MTSRPGASGEFEVNAPFRAWREIDDRDRDKLFTLGDAQSSWLAGTDGVALIELAEGVRMMSNVLTDDPAKVKIGAPVRVTFERASDEITLPKFELVAE